MRTNVTAIIRGSWGDLIVDRATGVILEYRDGVDMAADEVGYRDILFVLPETLAAGRDDCLDRHGETDILYIGFVDDAGRVTMPMIYDDPEGMLIDPLLLPAPAA
jgi:hypothetical protein